MNENFLNNTLDGFIKCAENRKLVLFGSGAEMYRAFNEFLDCNRLKPAYIVDNDFRMWYSSVFGYNVYEPSILSDEQPDEIVVLITSLYPYQIKKQIEQKGVINYYSSLLFVESMIGKRQFIVRF